MTGHQPNNAAGLKDLLLQHISYAPLQAPEPTVEAELRQAADAWRRAIDDRNADQIAAFFATHARAMYLQSLPTVGREANRQAWANIFSNPEVNHPVTVEEVVTSISCDLGYTYGQWWLVRPGDDLHSEGHTGGGYLAIWRPVYGQWQIVLLSTSLTYARRVSSGPGGESL